MEIQFELILLKLSLKSGKFIRNFSCTYAETW